MTPLFRNLVLCALALTLPLSCTPASAVKGADALGEKVPGSAPLAARAATTPASPITLVPQVGHGSSVLALVFSKNKQVLYSGGGDGTIKAWDVTTGALLANLSGHSNQVAALAVSPDGKTLASTGWDQEVKLWSLPGGALVRSFKGHEAPVRGVAFMPDGGHVVSASMDKTVRIWDVTGRNAPEVIKIGRPVTTLAIAPDGRSAALGTDMSFEIKTDEVHVLDLAKKTVVKSFPSNSHYFSKPAFMPDGVTMMGAAPKQALRDMRSGATIELGGEPGVTMAGAVDPAGQLVMIDMAGGLQSWDPRTGKPIRVVRKGDGSKAKTAAFSDDGALAATIEEGTGRVRIYDATDGRLVQETRSSLRRISSVGVSADGRRIVTAGEDGMVRVWDATTLGLERSFRGAKGVIRAMALSPDGKLALTGGEGAETHVRLWNVDTGTLVRTLRSATAEEGSGVLLVAIGPDGKRAYVDTNDKRFVEWDLVKGTQIGSMTSYGKNWLSPDLSRRLSANSGWANTEVNLRFFERGNDKHTFAPDAHRQYASAGAISADNKTVVTAGAQDKKVKLWDMTQWPSPKLVRTLDGSVQTTAAAVSRQGTVALLGDLSGVVRVWNLASGAIVREAKAHAGGVTSVALTADERYGISVGADGTVRLMRLGDGSWVALAASGDEWVAYDEEGMFDASRHGGELVTAVEARPEGLRAFRIDQLAARNNRPDLLLQRIGLGAPDVLAHFRGRYERRLKKLGLDPSTLDARFQNAPSATIVEAKVEGKTANLVVDLADPGGKLYRYDVFVNDVPLFGSVGKEVSGDHARISEKIELTKGRNKVEISTLSRSGLESQRAFRVVDSSVEARGDLYYVAFGVSKYKNAKLDLLYADKDALDLAATFTKMAGGAFRDVHIKTYVNEEASTANIRAAKGFVQGAKVDDTVVVFVAGHGTHTNDAAADYYFATHEVDVANLRNTAAPFELIEGLLQDIAPRRKLFLMDTCESGERDAESSTASAGLAGTRALRSRSTRGLVLDTQAARAPARSVAAVDRERYIYNDLARRTGAIVFSSSRGSESSFELETWKNGAFTAELKVAFGSSVADTNNDGMLSAEELRRYVSPAVAKRTDDLQHPTVDRDNLEIVVELPIPGAKGRVKPR